MIVDGVHGHSRSIQLPLKRHDYLLEITITRIRLEEKSTFFYRMVLVYTNMTKMSTSLRTILVVIIIIITIIYNNINK